MSKFARKPKEAPEASAKTERKEKIWTNNPEWQDQETGETTDAGKTQLKKVSAGKETKEETKTKGAKAAPKAKTAKAPAKKEKASNDDRKIKILSKENPYREGSKAAKTFDLMKKSKTVEDFKAGLTADHAAGYLNWAARDGYISVG